VAAAASVVAWAGAAAAWDFESSCAESKTQSFSDDQPQVYLMLDRSGSMGRTTSVSNCQECNYEYYQGTTVASDSASWSSPNATVSRTFSGFSSTSCMGAGFQVQGDYGWSYEYAGLYADGNGLGTICYNSSACSDCGGPYRGEWEVTSEASDGSVQMTVNNSYVVDGFCSTNRADFELVDYTSGSTVTGSFDCPNCATDEDCETAGNFPECAVKSATLGTYSCSSSLTMWKVASRSIRSVVWDMTDPDPDTAQFGLGMFTNDAWHEVDPQEDAGSKIESALQSNSPSGGTDIYDAIKQSQTALENAGSSSRLQASVLITDGEHNYNDTNVINAACEHHSKGDELYAVGFGDGTDVSFNHAVAAAGGTGTCCDPGTGPCSRGDSNYVDICSLSDAELIQYNDGRDLDCSGGYYTDTGTGLKNAVTTIASDLTCTVDVSNFGSQKWKDPYYDCAPHYDCFEVYIPGTAERIFHNNSSNSPTGWEWANASKQERIVLDDYYCNKVKSLSNNDVEFTRSCMCDEPKRQRCSSNASSKQTCECRADRWSCSQGVDLCKTYDRSNCPTALTGEGQSCEYGQGQCAKDGTTKCDAGGNLFCGTNESSYTIGQAFHSDTVPNDRWDNVSLEQNNYDRKPLVFATTITQNGQQDPSQAHVRNISKSGGETQHCEVEIESGGVYCDSHRAEKNSWFAFDPGRVRNLRGVDAGYYESSAGSEVHDSVPFGFQFRHKPLVFTQTQTDRGSDVPRNTQVVDRTKSAATVEFCEQDSTKGCGRHGRERVAWFAVDPSMTEVDGFEGGQIWARGGNTWYTVNFSQSFETAPFIVVDTQTEHGSDEALYVEARNVTNNSAEIRFCEYDGNDDCGAHTWERLAWMAFSRDAVTGTGYGDQQQAGTPPEDPETTCDGLDNDCDGQTDEGIGQQSCDTGTQGRCSQGERSCQNGGWTSCQQTKRAVPEICNGLDDDCNGVVDDISESWENSGSVDTDNLSDEERARVCAESGACVCPDADDRDDAYRSGMSAGARQQEFDDLVRRTVSNDTTDCECRE